MGTKFILTLVLFVTLISGSASNPKAETIDWRKTSEFEQSILAADRRGDFGAAAKAAENCVIATKNSDAAFQNGTGQPYCAGYLAMALRDGKGVPRDEVRAFSIIRDLASKSDWQSLDLVEAYLDGMGTPRNPVEAGVIFWRVDHGFLSSYSDYGGMCKDCEHDYAVKENLRQRIETELTAEERKRAELISINRFPQIADRVREQDKLFALATMSIVAVIIFLVFFRMRRFRKSLNFESNRTDIDPELS